ncbi:MAG: TA system antitoxin ParD family protein [Methylobacter sp.]
MISVTLSESLAHAATVQAEIHHRTLEKQIEHWAKIGKIAEENPDLSFEFIQTILAARKEAQEGQTEPYLFD